MIGDRPSDQLAGQNAGIPSLWVQTGQHNAAPIESSDPTQDPPKPRFTGPDLRAATDWILRKQT